MWWFAAAHGNLLMVYQRWMRDRGRIQPLLDAGCGTGGLLARIAAEYPERTVVGLDADRSACAWASAKSARPVCAGSVNGLPFGDAAFATIFSVDVLCHRNVDERQALAQFHRCLAREGVLILNLPAYRWMMSRHDTAVHNARRYTRKRVVDLLRASGFQLLYASYWNSLLFPLMVIGRKVSSAGHGTESDVKLYPPLVEAVCRAAMGIERAVLRCGIRLPFGGSVLAVAAKAETLHG